MSKRRKIPRQIKEIVKSRDKGCCVCPSAGREYHHVLPYTTTKHLGKLHHVSASNIVLLCEEHHRLFHLGDPEVFQAVYEHAWFLNFGRLPGSEDDMGMIAGQVKEHLKQLAEKAALIKTP